MEPEQMMQAEIKKWGNSAVVRLPASVLAALGFSVGARVELRQEYNRLIIEPIPSVRQGWFDVRPKLSEKDSFETIPPDEGDDEWVW